MLRSLLGYKLNERSFVDLEGKLSADIVPRLRVLSGQTYPTKRDFAKSVEMALGHQLTQQILAVILHEGKRFQLKRINRYFQSARETHFASAPFTPSLFNYIRLRPFFFTLWFKFRFLKHTGLVRLKGKPAVRKLDGVNEKYIVDDVLPYNLGQVTDFHDGHRYRTERMILLLKVLCGRHADQWKVLSVGPRNEAELLLFSLHGFSLKNIMGIDLFSHSPHIHVMDMHDMDFADDTFDIYYSAFTMAYSQDAKRACAEAIRVTRDGGLIAITNTLRGVSLMAGKETEFVPGVEDTLKLFSPNVRHVYFQEESEWQQDQIRDSEKRYVTVIFSIEKSPA